MYLTLMKGRLLSRCLHQRVTLAESAATCFLLHSFASSGKKEVPPFVRRDALKALGLGAPVIHYHRGDQAFFSSARPGTLRLSARRNLPFGPRWEPDGRVSCFRYSQKAWSSLGRS